MKKFILMKVLLFSSTLSFSQSINKIINKTEVERIEKILSADDMQGRKIFTASIDKAADFIQVEFKAAGLKPLFGLTDYRQSFSLIKSKLISATAIIDGDVVDQNNIIAITTKERVDLDEKSGYTVVYIDSSSNLMSTANKLIKEKKNYIVLVNSFHEGNFNKLKRYNRESFKTEHTVIFVSSNLKANSYHFNIINALTNSPLTNITGILPGKKKPEEYVIFSGHYDHIGIGKPNTSMDSIYNGANDDAAGITAVIMLAKYFKSIKANERSIIFVAFTAEESGGFGSQYFSGQIDAEKVVAMFNIEMIGTESKWGLNSAYITGFEKTDFGKILQQNLKGSDFHFEPDPYPTQQLFYRSDNATLAALGVPAHTISTSKMDSELNYHTQEDEIETLNLDNMVEIIKAIAISSKSIINGKDTPTRLEKLKN